MKKIINLFLGLVLISLCSCSGSDTYRGLWKAINEKGEKYEINFDAKSFTVKDSAGQIKTYQYKQHSVSIQNSVETYGIQVSDGREYRIHFPIGNDETKGAIQDATGRPIYIISRGKYIKYEDVYGLH